MINCKKIKYFNNHKIDLNRKEDLTLVKAVKKNKTVMRVACSSHNLVVCFKASRNPTMIEAQLEAKLSSRHNVLGLGEQMKQKS